MAGDGKQQPGTYVHIGLLTAKWGGHNTAVIETGQIEIDSSLI